MKKIFGLILGMLLLLSLTACGCEHEYDDGTVTQEATFDSAGEITYTCEICGDTYTEKIPQKEKTVIVTVTDKKNVPEDIHNGRFSDSVEFTFTVENQSDKPVKGVEGILYIKDLFDKDILSINCDFTGQTIPVNESVTVEGLGMDINPFMEDHSKLYQEDFSDLKFEYEITNIVYDGEATETEPVQNEEVPVQVRVVDKQNLPEDIHSGRFSSRVEFVIEVENKSDREIKGVSGTLTIKDLFGKDIKSVLCDFTGQTIGAGSTATYSELGMDINEFMDDDTKLYNEQFSDLNFEYHVDSIVYADGETETFN